METFSAYWHFVRGITGVFPSQRLVTQSFDVLFDLRLNKRLSTHSRWQWLGCHRTHHDVIVMYVIVQTYTAQIYASNLSWREWTEKYIVNVKLWILYQTIWPCHSSVNWPTMNYELHHPGNVPLSVHECFHILCHALLYSSVVLYSARMLIILLVFDLNRTPVFMAKHGGS